MEGRKGGIIRYYQKVEKRIKLLETRITKEGGKLQKRKKGIKK